MKNRLRPVLLLICALAGIAGAKPAGAQISGPTLQLASAIAGDDLAQASAAIADGADVNANAGDGRTPLIHAVLFIRPQLVKLLVERGAFPTAGESSGKPAPGDPGSRESLDEKSCARCAARCA